MSEISDKKIEDRSITNYAWKISVEMDYETTTFPDWVQKEFENDNIEYFVLGAGNNSSISLHIQTPNGEVRADMGDYLTRNSEGALYTIREETFENAIRFTTGSMRPKELRSLSIPGYVTQGTDTEEKYAILYFPLTDHEKHVYQGISIKPINLNNHNKDKLHFDSNPPLDILAFNNFIKDNKKEVQRYLDPEFSTKYYQRILNEKMSQSLPKFIATPIKNVTHEHSNNRSR